MCSVSYSKQSMIHSVDFNEHNTKNHEGESVVFFYICSPVLSFASLIIKIMYVETFIINIIFVLSTPEISSGKGKLTISFCI